MTSHRSAITVFLLIMMLAACGRAQEPTPTLAAPSAIEEVIDLASMASEKTITRAEMAVLLLIEEHGHEYRPLSAGGGLFNDVADHWAESWIEQLVSEGIGSGYPDGSFRPDEPVVRAEAAVFLLKAKHGFDYIPPAPTTSSFADVPGHWAEAWIEQLRAEGLTEGFSDGTYRPEQPLTAGELGVVIRGIFE